LVWRFWFVVSYHILHFVYNVKRESGSGATSYPCDVTEGRLVYDHTIHSIIQILDAFLGPGRKEFERENHTVVVSHAIVDLVNNLRALPLLLLMLIFPSFLSSPFRFLP
jgi:hypothetical protein